MNEEEKRSKKAPDTAVDLSYRLIHPTTSDSDDLFINQVLTDELATSFLDELERKSVNEIGSLIWTLKFVMAQEPSMDLRPAVNFFNREIKMICITSKSLNGRLLDHFTTSRTINELRYKDSSGKDKKKDEVSKNAFNDQETQNQWRMIQ